MAQDENILRGSYSGGTGSGGGGGGDGGGGGGGGLSTSICSRSKKGKQKKVPQRGLGVAQLERIRIEEQQRKEALQAANALANDTVQSSNFRPTFLPSPNPMPSSNVLQRSPNIEPLHQIPKQSNAGAGQIGVESTPSPGEEQMLELAYHPKVNLPYEKNASISTRTGLHQFRHPLAMMNATSEFSRSFSLSSKIEPPSNQSFRGNKCTNSSPEEDKMAVGAKRSYPFSLESPPAAPSFRGNVPICAASRSRTEELASCSNRYSADMDPRNKLIRESSSNSITLPEQDLTEVIRDDDRLKGNFLTLALPSTAASPPSNSKREHLLHYSSGLQGRELSDSKYLRSQENSRGRIQGLGSSGSTERSFCFFPDKFESDQAIGPGNDETSETIDLSLKL